MITENPKWVVEMSNPSIEYGTLSHEESIECRNGVVVVIVRAKVVSWVMEKETEWSISITKYVVIHC